jgi:hypothetical protein
VSFELPSRRLVLGPDTGAESRRGGIGLVYKFLIAMLGYNIYGVQEDFLQLEQLMLFKQLVKNNPYFQGHGEYRTSFPKCLQQRFQENLSVENIACRTLLSIGQE